MRMLKVYSLSHTQVDDTVRSPGTCSIPRSDASPSWKCPAVLVAHSCPQLLSGPLFCLQNTTGTSGAPRTTPGFSVPNSVPFSSNAKPGVPGPWALGPSARKTCHCLSLFVIRRERLVGALFHPENGTLPTSLEMKRGRGKPGEEKEGLRGFKERQGK